MYVTSNTICHKINRFWRRCIVVSPYLHKAYMFWYIHYKCLNMKYFSPLEFGIHVWNIICAKKNLHEIYFMEQIFFCCCRNRHRNRHARRPCAKRMISTDYCIIHEHENWKHLLTQDTVCRSSSSSFFFVGKTMAVAATEPSSKSDCDGVVVIVVKLAAMNGANQLPRVCVSLAFIPLLFRI